MINSDSGTHKELTTEFAYRHGLINHNMNANCAKSQYRSKSTLSRFCASVGAAGEIAKIAFRGGKVIHGRFPEVIRGASSVARDIGKEVVSIQPVDELKFKDKLTKKDNQVFFHAHL